jgi:glycosyltransferase involved in cell wall biosynthesis
MIIGFYLRTASFGGGERMKLTLMTEFLKHNHTIFIYTHNSEEVINLPFPFELILMKKRGNKLIQAVSDFLFIYKHFNKTKIDCLINFGFSTRWIIASTLNGICSIVYPTVDPKFYKNQIYLWLRTKICFQFCTGIIFQTETIRKRYSRHVQSKSIVILNPIMDDDLPMPQIERKSKIVSVGRLSPEKNFKMLISSYAMLNKNNYTLHIYGDGPQKNELVDLIEKVGLQDRIFLEGHVNRVVDKIADAEIFVLCSDLEGMPNALIEAMAMGLACISTDFPSGAARELITNKENGILVGVGETEELSDSIKELIVNSDLTQKISLNATNVRNLLSKQLIINKWHQYMLLLNKSE